MKEQYREKCTNFCGYIFLFSIIIIFTCSIYYYRYDIYLVAENALTEGLEFMRISRGHAAQRIIKYNLKQVRS